MRILPIQQVFKKTFSFKSSQAQNNERNLFTINDEFVKESEEIDIERLQALNLAHFRLFDSYSVRGVNLADKKLYVLEELKKSGINTIVDLRQEGGEDTVYARNCEDNGLRYFSLKMKPTTPIFNDIFSSKLTQEEMQKHNQAFVSKLPDFFEIMNQGYFYIHCLLGLHRTDMAASLNYLVNPLEPDTPPTLSHMHMPDENNHTLKYVAKIKKMISNLTKENVDYLKLTEEYKKIFNIRTLKLKMMNGVK